MENDTTLKNFLTFDDLEQLMTKRQFAPTNALCLKWFRAGLGGTMQLPDWFPEYAGFTGLAAVGSVARGKQWFDPVTGKFSKAKFLTEASIAVGLAAVIGGLGVTWHIEISVLCALCVGAGWLGPETVSKLVLDKLGVKP